MGLEGPGAGSTAADGQEWELGAWPQGQLSHKVESEALPHVSTHPPRLGPSVPISFLIESHFVISIVCAYPRAYQTEES